MHYCTFKGDKGNRPGKLLSVNSAQKLNFCISLLIFQKIRSFSINEWLGRQALTFEFLKIKKSLFSHVIILYLAKKGNFLSL